jgi:hypothetical protein
MSASTQSRDEPQRPPREAGHLHDEQSSLCQGDNRQENQRRQEVSQVLCQPWEGPNQSHSHTRLGLKLGFHIILSLPAHGLCCGSSLCRTTDMQKGANTERPLTIVLWP